MTEEELDALVHRAIIDLDTTGMHWLSSSHSKRVFSAIKERWPNMNIVSSRPAPHDESVIFDEQRADVEIGQLPSIAAARHAARHHQDT